MTPHPHRLAFIAASASLLAIFAAGACPIPLYNTYRQLHGISYNVLALTAVGYFCGAVTALLVFGRLSNHFGRRPVALLALGLAAIGCLLLTGVTGPMPLIAGRILQGLACGLASSAISAYVVDSAPVSPPWLAAATATNAPMVGLTIGALGSAALVEYGPVPRVLPYLAIVALLCTCALLIVLGKETVKRRPGALASLRPRLSLPDNARKLFPVASCTFIATWALGGFYQAFGASIAADQLGAANALVAAAVFSSMMAPSAIGGPLAGRLSPANAQRIGMLVFALAAAAILVSLKNRMVLPFLAASAVAGAAQGATLTGSIRALLSAAGPAERAGVLSVIYATSYSGAAVPSLIAGQLSRTHSLLQIASGYGMLAALGCAITLLAARDPAPAGLGGAA